MEAIATFFKIIEQKRNHTQKKTEKMSIKGPLNSLTSKRIPHIHLKFNALVNTVQRESMFSPALVPNTKYKKKSIATAILCCPTNRKRKYKQILDRALVQLHSLCLQ